MEQSILKSTKKVLQIGPDDETFDLDILMHINSAFSTLNDLGVGPEPGFAIEDDSAVWTDFLADNLVQLNRVKTFVLLHTRLLFDPPATTFHLESAKNQLEEVTWRLSVRREGTDWVDPDPPVMEDPDTSDDPVLDGGSA
jgi:hypothetical protein